MNTEQMLQNVTGALNAIPQTQTTIESITSRLDTAIKTQLILQAISTACVLYLALDVLTKRK